MITRGIIGQEVSLKLWTICSRILEDHPQWSQSHNSIADYSYNPFFLLEDEISSSDTKQINMAKNLAGHTEIFMLENLAS